VTQILPVLQADHDAVQAFHRTMLDRLMSDVKSQRPKLGDDEGDAGTLVQAFARHRTTAEAGKRELVEALTPSGATKAAYSGEFEMTVSDTDEDGHECWRKVLVPWDVIKQIMAAISARATLAKHGDAA